MANNADALYATIFDTIAKLNDKDAPMELDRAKAISGAVQSAVNLAKVEVEHMKVAGGNGVSFFSGQSNAPELPSGGNPKVITHRLRG